MPDSDFFIDYSSLDDFQRQLIDRKNNKSMAVSGSAGSGKSLIALHKAKQIAALGDTYAIIVYTKSLRKYFEDGLRTLGLRNVYHYHQWLHNKHNVKYLIVDECQDFNATEIDDFRSHGTYCWFFGDTNQSIMDFKPTINSPGHKVQSVEETAKQLGIHSQDLCINHRLTIENAFINNNKSSLAVYDSSLIAIYESTITFND